MRLLMSCVAAVTAVVLGGALPVAADVSNSPNSVPFGPGVCPEIGLEFELAVSPTGRSASGHDADTNVVGVGKTIYLTDSSGNILAVLVESPGRSLKNNTVFCFWEDPGSPTGYIGADILFSAAVRGGG